MDGWREGGKDDEFGWIDRSMASMCRTRWWGLFRTVDRMYAFIHTPTLSHTHPNRTLARRHAARPPPPPPPPRPAGAEGGEGGPWSALSCGPPGRLLCFCFCFCFCWLWLRLLWRPPLSAVAAVAACWWDLAICCREEQFGLDGVVMRAGCLACVEERSATQVSQPIELITRSVGRSNQTVYVLLHEFQAAPRRKLASASRSRGTTVVPVAEQPTSRIHASLSIVSNPESQFKPFVPISTLALRGCSRDREASLFDWSILAWGGRTKFEPTGNGPPIPAV